MGEGFCTPSSRGTNNRGGSRARPAGRTRSGAGCVLDDAEWVGGDLPAILGGGGVRLDRDTADECFNRCEENPRCTWYTYDTRYMYVLHLKMLSQNETFLISNFFFASKPRVF